MGVDNYALLKSGLNLSVAVDWLYEDSWDDFFPDAFMFRDIRDLKNDYLEQRQHRVLQVDAIPSIMEYAPKLSGMLREAIWLHPSHRILYLAVLHHLLPKLDKLTRSAIYSYRLDRVDDPDAYPFPDRSDRWKQFQNDFRSAALDDSTNAVLVTDLAAFFDHISIDLLIQRIGSMLGRSMDSVTQSVVEFLGVLLNLWSTTGYGIPQNLDASSFFGSLYLHNVDVEILDKRYRYFRWLDDIRICAQSHDQAVRALHDLQRTLARDGLFLAGDKTKVLEKGTEEFNALVDVEDDVAISEAEEVLTTGDQQTLAQTAETLLPRLEFHSSPEGDDRKFRAFANRLLSIADFEELTGRIHPEIKKLVLPRLRTHPSRSDYWTKMLLQVADEDVLNGAFDLLATRPSLFDWQRFHILRMLTHLESLSAPLVDRAKSTARVGVSILERAQAVMCVGKHGSNTDRDRLFAELFSAQTPYPVQRALVVALQGLPDDLRDRLFRQALQTNSDHKQLVDFLCGLREPCYGERPRTRRHCRDEAQTVNVFLKSGVGLVRGERTTFRLSRSHYDYE